MIESIILRKSVHEIFPSNYLLYIYFITYPIKVKLDLDYLMIYDWLLTFSPCYATWHIRQGMISYHGHILLFLHFEETQHDY